MDRQYVWGIRYIDEMICRDEPTRRLYVLQDANFNVTALVNTAWNVYERFVYDPYGNASARDAAWSPIAEFFDWAYRHQGGRLDTGTGLYNFRNRDYQADLGRWGQRDPINFGNTTLYEFVGNMPTGFVDPSGLALIRPSEGKLPDYRNPPGGPKSYTNDFPSQHTSSNEHGNYQTFTMTCPEGYRASNPSVTYDGMDDCLLLKYQQRTGTKQWDPNSGTDPFYTQFDAQQQSLADEGYGSIVPGSLNGVNCNGTPSIINTYMRTRAVGVDAGVRS